MGVMDTSNTQIGVLGCRRGSRASKYRRLLSQALPMTNAALSAS